MLARRLFPLQESGETSLAELPGGDELQVEKLRRIYKRDITASQTVLEQSLSNLGDLRNVRKAVRKLVTGQPIKVVALGGSVTLGHGPRSINNSFVHQFFDWIQEAFPAEHQLINHGQPAITSSYTCPCALDLVPEDVDLVFLEFTLNDSERGARQLEHPIVRSLERMLRKLLRLPSQPGIVYVHYWAGRLLRHEPQETVEDTYNALLKYYSVMGISMRDGLRQLHATDEHAIDDMFLPEWDPDRVHPTCIGSRYLADLLIGHFQDLAASELLDPTPYTPLPPISSSAAVPGGAHNDSLDVPLQANNWALNYEACLQNPAEVQRLMRPVKGFQWVDEGKRSPKLGYVGREPGDVLEVDVPVAGLEHHLTIGLGFLLSYEHMGQASVERREYSFWWPYRVSLTGWRVVEVLHPPEADICTLRVTILDRTRDERQEHKVKVSSLMLLAGKEVEFTMLWLHCDECAQ